jgi:predicted transposase YdaD
MGGRKAGEEMTEIKEEAAEYALGLLEKGYRIAELASILKVDVETMQQVIDEATEKRAEKRKDGQG